MSTRKQRAANRRNAPDAPRPAASHFNSAKHGIFAAHQIMFDESAEDLAELASEYHQQYNPANSTERFLVDTLINNEWRLRRLRRVEAELWDHATNAFMAKNTEVPACTSGDSFATGSDQFVRLQQVVNSCERNYSRALKELQVARAHGLRSPQSETGPAAASAAAPEPTTEPAHPPQPQQSKTGSAKLASFRQNPNAPPATSNSNPGDAATIHPGT